MPRVKPPTRRDAKPKVKPGTRLEREPCSVNVWMFRRHLFHTPSVTQKPLESGSSIASASAMKRRPGPPGVRGAPGARVALEGVPLAVLHADAPVVFFCFGGREIVEALASSVHRIVLRY